MAILSRRLLDPRLAARGLRASGVIGAVGIAFLVGMFAAFGAGARSAGMALGWVNDVTGVVTLPLAVPGMLALHARIRPQAGAAGDVLLVIGIGSTGAIVVLQLLLVAGVVPFEQQIGPVSVAFLALAAWFVLTGRIAARAGVLPARHAPGRARRELRRLPDLGVPAGPDARRGTRHPLGPAAA